MKLILLFDRKKKTLDYFPWTAPGPVPPIINPPEPEEPKDTAPPEPKPEPKPS